MRSSPNDISLWRVECIIKGRNLSHLHKKITEKKYDQVFCCKQFNGWNEVKELSGKWPNNVLLTLFCLRLGPTTFFNSTGQTKQKRRIFYNTNYLKNCKNTLYNAKHTDCLKLKNLNVRFEISFHVTNKQRKCHFTNNILPS